MRIAKFLPVVVAVALAATACSEGGDTTTPSDQGEYPRSETLYTQGTAWGPPSSFNVVSGNYAALTGGNIFEPLFIFDPFDLELSGWLAENGEWSGDYMTYTVTLRDGTKWSDGEDLTADDVVYTVELAKKPGVPYANVYNYLDSVTASDPKTVVFTFKQARVQEFENFLYNTKIVPEHVWSQLADDAITTETFIEPDKFPVGSGPYKVLKVDTDRVVYQKRDDYWGKDSSLGFDPKPKFVIDLVNTSNEVSMGLLLQNKSDLNNNYIPGITDLVQGKLGISGIKTYFDDVPYELAANTAVVLPNNEKFPTSDADFRQALAYAINSDNIVNNVYGGMVTKADATGLMPQWEQYYVSTGEKFSYDVDKAKQILDQAGFKDKNGDGFVEGPDGQKISITIQVPTGWTDWMSAAQSIAADAQAAGIDLTPIYPEASAVTANEQAGTYDLAVNNNAALSNSPWTFYNYVYQLPLSHPQPGGNNLQFTDDAATWDLVQQLASTPREDDAAFKGLLTQIEDKFLADLPVIPLWYNGAWAQFTTQTWVGWPSDASGPHYIPAAWNNYWDGFGSIRILGDISLASS